MRRPMKTVCRQCPEYSGCATFTSAASAWLLFAWSHTHTHTHNHFTALWTLSGTTWVSRHQKAHFANFLIFWSKMKIRQADAPTIWMNCHPIQTNWCPHLCHPHHFYARCPSLHNPPNLSWLGTGTKYAGLHTQWLRYFSLCLKIVENAWVKL